MVDSVQQVDIDINMSPTTTPPSSLESRLASALKSRSSRQILRSLSSPTTLLSQTTLTDFSSNDYLSLSHSKPLKEAYLASFSSSSSSPYGPPSSRLLDGNSLPHLELEDQLSNFLRAPAGLLFNSGFDANTGLWACLPSAEDYILYDELIHASTHDGMRLSRVPAGKRRSFIHNDVASLKEAVDKIKRDDAGVREGKSSVWIAVETLYSMDGDLSPLKEMVVAVEESLELGNGHFVVDEAHSTGIYGPQGRGIVCALGLANRITIRVHTFGKAIACSGGVVLCTPVIRSYLINYCRPLIYSTALPRMNVLAIKNAFLLLESGETDAQRNHLHKLSEMVLNLLSSALPSPSPFISIPIKTISKIPILLLAHPETTPIIPFLTPFPRPLSAFLATKGFLVRPITHPTVPKGKERVRICLHAGNTKDEVERLVAGIKEWVTVMSRNSKL